MSNSEPSPTPDPAESVTGTLDTIAKAAQQGAADASEAAARTWSATSRLAARFVYTTCYTISYGVVFPSVLLARAVPRDNAAVRGLIEGAHAAQRRVEALPYPAIASSSDTTAALSPA
jgi:hypothetical protein